MPDPEDTSRNPRQFFNQPIEGPGGSGPAAGESAVEPPTKGGIPPLPGPTPRPGKPTPFYASLVGPDAGRTVPGASPDLDTEGPEEMTAQPAPRTVSPTPENKIQEVRQVVIAANVTGQILELADYYDFVQFIFDTVPGAAITFGPNAAIFTTTTARIFTFPQAAARRYFFNNAGAAYTVKVVVTRGYPPIDVQAI